MTSQYQPSERAAYGQDVDDGPPLPRKQQATYQSAANGSTGAVGGGQPMRGQALPGMHQAVYDQSVAVNTMNKNQTLQPTATYDRSNGVAYGHTNPGSPQADYDNTLPRGQHLYDNDKVSALPANKGSAPAVYDASAPGNPVQQQQPPQQAGHVYDQSAAHNVVYTPGGAAAARSGYHVAVADAGASRAIYEQGVDPLNGMPAHKSRNPSFTEPVAMANYESALNGNPPGMPTTPTGLHAYDAYDGKRSDLGGASGTDTVTSSIMYDNFDSNAVLGGKRLAVGAEVTYDTADDAVPRRPTSDTFDDNAFVASDKGVRVASVRRNNPMYRDSRLYQDTGKHGEAGVQKEHLV